MRIISGRNRGRRITAPANLPVRPTTDAAKESLFNIVNNHFDFSAISVLDLFTGTGNISYEFASRGCPDITAVDADRRCIDFIRTTAERLNYDAINPLQSDYLLFLNRASQQWDLIFADPPYAMEMLHLIPETILKKTLLNTGGWLVIEHDKHHDLSGNEMFYEQRKYGKVNFSFFRKNES